MNILGPTLHGQAVTLGTSEENLIKLLNGKSEKIPNISVPVCDVRDVALAQFKCAFSPSAVGHRHPILSQKEKGIWKTIAGILHEEFAPKGYKVPTDDSEVTPTVNIQVDNSRMINELGIKPRPLKQTVIDMANSLINAGLVTKS
jgi:nucleoside-diphosphate-sugar epimerase